MDINLLLGGVDCSCGRRHECNIEAVHVERGAIAEHLSEVCREERILIVADENTYSAAGEICESALAGKTVSRVIFDGGRVLIPDERAIERVRTELSGCELILGIGSGVVQDLCKYVSYVENIPYVIVATAPSMDGYASTGAAMILGGMKETVAAGLPRAIVADTEILRNAPMDMIVAGYGDIIGKYSALADWRLSAIVNGEYICEDICEQTLEIVERTAPLGKRLLERDGESIEELTAALIAVGIMMSRAGSSRPASGSEHHLSHFFEIVGIIREEPYFAHGIDVAYSAIVTAWLRERLLERGFAVGVAHSAEHYTERIRKIYGPIAESCIALQERPGLYKRDRLPVYSEREREIRALFSSLPSAKMTRELVESVGLDVCEFVKAYGERKIRDAIAYAKDLKDRYTVLCMNYDVFGDECDG